MDIQLGKSEVMSREGRKDFHRVGRRRKGLEKLPGTSIPSIQDG